MTKKAGTSKVAAEKLIQNIRRKTWQTYSAEEKIRNILNGEVPSALTPTKLLEVSKDLPPNGQSKSASSKRWPVNASHIKIHMIHIRWRQMPAQRRGTKFWQIPSPTGSLFTKSESHTT
jgi:hypothetical protein